MNHGDNSQDNQTKFGHLKEQENHQDQSMLGVDELYDVNIQDENAHADGARGEDGGGEEGERAVAEEDVYRVPKPRLKWTPQLHDHFVKAVEKLGGPSKATPKAILSVMDDVNGLSLYHLKSHLQKFRLGKISKKLLWRKNFQPSDYYRKTDGRKSSPWTYLEVGEGSSSSGPAGIIGSSSQVTSQAPSYGNGRPRFVEPAISNPRRFRETRIPTPNSVEQQHAAINREEDFASDTPPSMLSLFPDVPKNEKEYPINYRTDSPIDLLSAEETSCGPNYNFDNLLTNEFVNSLDFSSDDFLDLKELDLNQEDDIDMVFEPFFDDMVESSSNVDDGKSKGVMVENASVVDNKEGCDNLTREEMMDESE